MPLLLAVAVPVLLPMTPSPSKAGVTDDCVAKAVERAATLSLNAPFYWATVIIITFVNHSATTTALMVAAVNCASRRCWACWRMCRDSRPVISLWKFSLWHDLMQCTLVKCVLGLWKRHIAVLFNSMINDHDGCTFIFPGPLQRGRLVRDRPILIIKSKYAPLWCIITYHRVTVTFFGSSREKQKNTTKRRKK